MTEGSNFPDAGGNRGSVWMTVVGAAAGAAAIYFLSTERGRAWLRELPDYGRCCASTVRQAMALVKEIAAQIEETVGSFEQALDRVGQSIASRESDEESKKPLAA